MSKFKAQLLSNLSIWATNWWSCLWDPKRTWKGSRRRAKRCCKCGSRWWIHVWYCVIRDCMQSIRPYNQAVKCYKNAMSILFFSKKNYFSTYLTAVQSYWLHPICTLIWSPSFLLGLYETSQSQGLLVFKVVSNFPKVTTMQHQRIGVSRIN